MWSIVDWKAVLLTFEIANVPIIISLPSVHEYSRSYSRSQGCRGCIFCWNEAKMGLNLVRCTPVDAYMKHMTMLERVMRKKVITFLVKKKVHPQRKS